MDFGRRGPHHYVVTFWTLCPVLAERHVPWREDFTPERISVPVARLRYTADKTWTLYWRDRHLRFHVYGQLARRKESTTDDRDRPRSHVHLQRRTVGSAAAVQLATVSPVDRLAILAMRWMM